MNGIIFQNDRTNESKMVKTVKKEAVIGNSSNDGLVSDIKNNAWVTVNNDFWVTSETICQ